MSAFHKIVATVRAALERTPTVPARSAHEAAEVPIAPNGRRTELISQFARELEAVKGEFLGVWATDEIRARAVALAREINARCIAIGSGVVIDLDPVVRALEQSGAAVIRPPRNGAERAVWRARLAACDLGLVEAHAAIAATGTLAVVGCAERPSSLTLLPPANLILIHADRVVADLAAAVAAIGAERFRAHRVALITGPSRTADIEKMIVLGVHGPRRLYAAAVWPQEI